MNTESPADNFVQTFQLESSNLRGRIVRLGGSLDNIIAAHDYPLVISHLAAETVTLALLLSSMLKYDGIFTLQAQGDGVLKMLVSDVTSDGIVRGCASFDTDHFKTAPVRLQAIEGGQEFRNNLAEHFGKGYLAFTVDQKNASERYQGIVELSGASMTECVQHYFVQSEQIRTTLRIAVGRREGHWRAGGIMLQNLPENDKNMLSHAGEEDWRRANILLSTCTDEELLDPVHGADELLLCLFHEEGVRVYDKKEIKNGCRCDEGRVKNILHTMSDDDLAYIAVDGVITMTCEFCSKHYTFDFEGLRNENSKK